MPKLFGVICLGQKDGVFETHKNLPSEIQKELYGGIKRLDKQQPKRDSTLGSGALCPTINISSLPYYILSDYSDRAVKKIRRMVCIKC